MDELNLKALAKINIGLDVLRKREDGYHEVRMIMQTIHLFDRLHIKKTKEPGIQISSNLYYLPVNENNLIHKAAALLMDEFSIKEGVEFRLEKHIPVAAGMAGGSTDAAAALYGMNQMFDLGLNMEQLKEQGLRVHTWTVNEPEQMRRLIDLGADIIINSGKESVIDAVRQATDGSGADAAIDITGNGKAIVDGIRALRKAGIMVSVGLPDGEIPINLTEDIIYREVIYTGISGRRMFETWEDCMQILQTPGFSLEPAIGGVYPLSDFEEALNKIKSGVPGKMILIP